MLDNGASFISITMIFFIEDFTTDRSNMHQNDLFRLVDYMNFTVLFKYEVECEGIWLLSLYQITSVFSSIIVATMQVKL